MVALENSLTDKQLANLKKLIWHYKLPAGKSVEDETDVNAVLRYLSDLTLYTDEKTRVLVAKTLPGALDSEYADRLLLRLLCDKNPDVSWWAFIAFPNENVRDYLPELNAIINDKFLPIYSRIYGVHMIHGTWDAELVHSMLAHYLFDVDEVITGFAAEYMGWYKFREYQSRLLELFESDNVDIKAGAMLGLGYLRYSKRPFVKQVIALLDNHSPLHTSTNMYLTLSQSALTTLSTIETKQAQKAHEQWQTKWIENIQQLFKSEFN